MSKTRNVGSKPSTKRGVSKQKTSARDKGLSKKSILKAALKLLDEKGVEGFGMRALANKMGVYPTALYWYFDGGRGMIIGEIVGLVLGDIAPKSDKSDWKAWIEGLFENYRKAVARHPNFAPLIGSQLVSNSTSSINLIEDLLTVLEGAGFEGERLIDAYNAVIAAMVGYVTLEFAPESSAADEQWAREYQEQLTNLDVSKYPKLSYYIDRLRNRAFITRWESSPMPGGYALYVSAFLNGLEQELNKLN